MVTEITAEQRAALKAADRIEVIDPETQEQFVLLRQTYYERMMKVVDYSDITDDERQAAFREFGKSVGWTQEDSPRSA